jgi:ABC-type transporter Mla subunit MlaD
VRTPLTWIEKVVGFFVVLIFALLALTIFATAQKHNVFDVRTPYEIKTFLHFGYGLKVGSDVKIQDVEAGVVTVAKLAHEHERDKHSEHFDRNVIVVIRLDPDFADFLSVSTTAIVKQPPIGGSYIELQTNPDWARYGKLFDKSHKAEVDAEAEDSLFSKLAKIKDDVASVKDKVIDTLDNLAAIIENLRKMTEAIEDQEGVVGHVIHDTEMANDIAAALSNARAATDDLRVTASNASRASEPVPAATEEAKALVTDLRGTVQKADRTLDPLPAVIASVERSLADVEVLVKNLRDASSGVPEIVRKADTGLAETNRVIEAAQKSFLLRGNLPDRPAPRSESEALPRGGAN